MGWKIWVTVICIKTRKSKCLRITFWKTSEEKQQLPVAKPALKYVLNICKDKEITSHCLTESFQLNVKLGTRFKNILITSHCLTFWFTCKAQHFIEKNHACSHLGETEIDCLKVLSSLRWLKLAVSSPPTLKLHAWLTRNQVIIIFCKWARLLLLNP